MKLAPLGLNKADLQASVRQCLDQLIQTMNYPKQLFTFNLTLVQDFTQGKQVFPALMNACIALLNQAGICQREAPFCALSLEGLEVVANPKGAVLWMKTTEALDFTLMD